MTSNLVQECDSILRANTVMSFAVNGRMQTQYWSDTGRRFGAHLVAVSCVGHIHGTLIISVLLELD